MLAEMMAVQNGQITEDMLLGVCALYAMPDRPVPAHTLASAWAAEGLPPKLVPDGRRPVHVFQRACESVKSRSGVPSANRLVEVASDLVSHQDGVCVYQITRLVRDKANQVIEHEKAMTLVYHSDRADTDPNQIEVIVRDAESYLALRDTEQKVRDYYLSHLETVPGKKIRDAVRGALLSVNGISLRGRSGGCYFVPKAGISTCESIQRVLSHVYNDPTAAFLHALPWLDSDGMRQIVQQHHEVSVRERAEALTAELSERLTSDKKPRADYVANKLNERREIGQQVREYAALLGEKAELAMEALRIYDDKLDDLLSAAAE